MRDEIERRFPKILRRVGGYNLDEFVDPAQARSTSRSCSSAPRARSAWSSRRSSTWCRCRRPRRCSSIEFDDLLDALGGDAARSCAIGPSAVEVMDRFILDHAQRERRRSTRCGEHPATAIPARCCASSSTATAPRICRRGSTRSSATSRRRGSGCHWRRAIDAGGPGAHLELARSGARPVDGDEGRRQGALVRRGHGRRARAAARLHRRFLADRRAARHHGRRLRPRLGRLPARAAGRQPEDRGRRAHVRGDRRTTSPTWCSSSAARSPASTATAWCAARSRRRCSARCSTRRSARSSGPSIRTASSTPARSSTRRR